MKRTCLTTALALLLATGPAAAQYRRPGALGEARGNMAEQLRRAYKLARWQLGPLQLEPKLEISDVGYVSNIYFATEGEEVSDLKAQATAGLRGFFNLGPKVLVSPFAELIYTWWQDQDELRSTNDGVGLHMLGDFNRLQLQLRADRVETQSNLSSELEVPVDQRSDNLELAVDVDFFGPFRAFAGARETRRRFFGTAAEERVPGLDLATLDAEDQLLRGGVAYELGSGLRIGLGVERIETTFSADPGGRSNRGSGPLLTIGFEGEHLSVDIDAARRDLEFEGSGRGGNRRQTSGLAQVRLEVTEKLAGVLYGGVQLSASALDRDAVFESVRGGLRLQRDQGPRTRLIAFYEVGDDEFSRVADDRVGRLDDVRSYGVDLQFQLTPRLRVEIGYLDTRRTSSDRAFDRDLRSLTSRISLGSNLLP